MKALYSNLIFQLPKTYKLVYHIDFCTSIALCIQVNAFSGKSYAIILINYFNVEVEVF